MPDEPVVVEEVRWVRLFPWLRLLRSIGLATDAPKLILAALGLVLLWGGWHTLDRIFPGSADGVTLQPLEQSGTGLARGRGALAAALASVPASVAEPALVLIEPFRHVFSVRVDAWAFLHATLAALWGLLVWGIIGGSIARLTAVQAAGFDRLSLIPAVKFSIRHYDGLIGAPLVPFVAIAVFAALCALFGTLYRIPLAIGPIVAGVFLFLPLLAGLVMTAVLAGLALAWPLMHAGTAAEGEDLFDALSRSYSYVNQRLGKYAAYAAVAWLMGMIGLFVVVLFAWLVIQLALWALSLGAPAALVSSLFLDTATAAETTPVASAIHGFWLSAVGLLVHGWIYSYFWTSATLIYLLLRLDVDGVPWNVVYRPEGEEVVATPLSAVSGPLPPETVPVTAPQAHTPVAHGQD